MNASISSNDLPYQIVPISHSYQAETCYTRFRSKSARAPVPYRVSAPRSPTAFGRWKIQFC
ncbi:MAG: hypothetical protein OXD35_06355 [Thiotrichales bacterium]|nr:hypothetical protein [Thiotrichales bacterium]